MFRSLQAITFFALLVFAAANPTRFPSAEVGSDECAFEDDTSPDAIETTNTSIQAASSYATSVTTASVQAASSIQAASSVQSASSYATSVTTASVQAGSSVQAASSYATPVTTASVQAASSIQATPSAVSSTVSALATSGFVTVPASSASPAVKAASSASTAVAASSQAASTPTFKTTSSQAASDHCGDTDYVVLTDTPWIVYNMLYNADEMVGTQCTNYQTAGTLANGEQEVVWNSVTNIEYVESTNNVPKGYSFVGLTQNLENTISSISAIPANYTWTRTNTTAFKGNVCFDFMTSDTKGDSTSSSAQELMLWLQYEGGQLPIGWGDAVATIDSLFGTSWKLYEAKNTDTGITVHSLLPDTQFEGSFDGDLKDWLEALVTIGKFTDKTYVNVGNAGTEFFYGNSILNATPVEVAKVKQNAAKQELQATQKCMKTAANKHRRSVDFGGGNFVWLAKRHLRTERPSRKLEYPGASPHKIIQQVGNTFKLQLPESMNIHAIFSPYGLRKAAQNTLPEQENTAPPPVNITRDDESKVQEILSSKASNG
ncbi:Xyloglucan-specific endo-beta-1,4-glucanase A [Lachnellula cervina]|uniref:Xyloglucan-specific endo-beta-1,4-glucanase A n=1 Tax=Lachnellula cervina TaxID=1316786 RepID=A0A7D8YWY0_9HELO|nr:Xyloglucan-specific endo-beta-1,4-glucanase A [Lachnellula cervina]